MCVLIITCRVLKALIFKKPQVFFCPVYLTNGWRAQCGALEVGRGGGLEVWGGGVAEFDHPLHKGQEEGV